MNGNYCINELKKTKEQQTIQITIYRMLYEMLYKRTNGKLVKIEIQKLYFVSFLFC